MTARKGPVKFFYAIFFVALCGGLPFPLAAQSGPPEPGPAAQSGPGGAGETEAVAENAETAAGEDGPAAEDAAPVDPALRIIEMDIKTSSMAELAAWCRNLGLSEGGAREELARRLREHFKLVESGAAEGEEERRTIIIESARSTQYFTLEVVDEEYARLQGDVVVSLKDGDTVHRIKAWEILYNRTRNLMSASGGVEYVKESGDTVETFRGDSVTVNLDNWSSVFLDGISERSLQSDSTTYRFAGTVISRSEEEVTVLNRASITNANNEEALWSLNASKIWLLPGSDFAIFNAVLKVGEIPVLYFPFFHYPADEVIFHPVLGYRSREGNFLQTTTYILGRPRASSTSESSITKILGNSADMEKRREGIFLRTTGKKAVDPDAASLKAIVDIYANLGAYLGTEMTLPGKGIFGATELSAGVGFTRTVVPMGSGYTPFAAYDGTSEWNKSKFISWDAPFRYRLKAGGSLSGRFGSLSWALPYYSDPFVDKDFVSNRVEEMDWMHMIQEGAALEESTSTGNELGSYVWQINGSLRPSLPFLAPYISDISLSSFLSTVTFRTRTLSTANPNYNGNAPNRSFFYPDKYIFSLSGSLSGTPLTLGGNQAAREEGKAQEAGGGGPLATIGIPRSPWDPAPEAPKREEPGQLVPPVLGQRFELPRSGRGVQLSVNYRIVPTAASELQFRSNESRWPEYDKINWGDVYYIKTTLGGDINTTLNLNQVDSIFTNAFTFSGTGYWQTHNYLNEETEDLSTGGLPDPAKIRTAREQVYKQTYFTTYYGYTFALRPLYFSGMWGNSSLQYSFKGLLAKSVFTGTGDQPKWEVQRGAWNREDMESHHFSANVAASVMDHIQNLVLTADLPPEESAITGNTTLRAWISETNLRMKVVNPMEEAIRKVEPLYTTETLKFGNLGSFQLYMVYDPAVENMTTITSNLSLSNFAAFFSITRTKASRLNYLQILDPAQPDGWIQVGDEQLLPQEFSFRYNQSFTKEGLWNKRLNFTVNVNAALAFDFQRYTNSRFNLGLGLTLAVSHFLDVTLSYQAENRVIYRYFKGWSFFDMPGNLPAGEQDNFFIDLANSFRFDDDEKRRSSGFKINAFNLALTHYLGDWKATLGIKLTPYVDELRIPRIYRFNNEISFVIQWIPISEIKSDIQYNTRYDDWLVK
jgi:hypothetical protein